MVTFKVAMSYFKLWAKSFLEFIGKWPAAVTGKPTWRPLGENGFFPPSPGYKQPGPNYHSLKATQDWTMLTMMLLGFWPNKSYLPDPFLVTCTKSSSSSSQLNCWRENCIRLAFSRIAVSVLPEAPEGNETVMDRCIQIAYVFGTSLCEKWIM